MIPFNRHCFCCLLILLLFGENLLYSQSFQVGTRSITFTDPSRGNRSIACDVYYPATNSGNNAPLASGVFSYVVFGHGFLMPTSAYQPIAQSIAASGLVVFLPTTESGFSPSHTNFARDLAFVGTNAHEQSVSNSNFFFYESLSDRYAVGGHSMGGGCTYLSVQFQSSLPATCLFTFAAAETNPSAIAQMSGISMPNLIIGGSLDCVTPPAGHQIPMYNAQNSNACRYLVLITGGYHCQFNASNFTCSLGENSCIPPGGISREVQLGIALSLTLPWLQGWLEPNCAALADFANSIEAEDGFTVEQSCDLPQLDQPLIAYDGGLTRCEGDWITLEAVPGIGDITWSTGEQTITIVPLQSGIYSYTLSNGQCELEAEAVEVVYIPAVQALIQAAVPPVLCPGDEVILEASPSGSQVLWNTGESSPTISIRSSGSYWFTLTDGPCQFLSDTLDLQFPDPVFPFVTPAGLAVLCPGDSIQLQAQPAIGMVQWSNGADTFTQSVNEEGDYSFELVLNGCSFLSDTLRIEAPEDVVLKVLSGERPTICDGDAILLSSSIRNGNILWSNGASGPDLNVMSAGVYSCILEVSGCLFMSDTIEVREVNRPSLGIEADGTLLCPLEDVELRALVSGGEVIWSNGQIGRAISISVANSYYFTLDSLGCIYRSDSIDVVAAENIFLPLETEFPFVLCEGSTLVLTQPNSMDVRWSNGEENQSIEIATPGLYYYTLDTLNCTYRSDSLFIDQIARPEFLVELSSSELLCWGVDSAEVLIVHELGRVLWSDGDTSSFRIIDSSGIYSFELQNGQCFFAGETFEFQFYGTWTQDSLEIEGESLVFRDSVYLYSIALSDTNAIFDWRVVSGDAELLGSSSGPDAFSELRIGGNAIDTIVLECEITDRVCGFTRLIQKIIVPQGSSNVQNTDRGAWLRVHYDEGSWVLLDIRDSDEMKVIRLVSLSGILVSERRVNGSLIRIDNQALKPGMYLLEIEWRSGAISPPLKLIKY